MQRLILIALTILLARAAQETAEPGSCLLQTRQGNGGEVQQAALAEKSRQDPAHDLDLGDSANDEAAGANENDDDKPTEKEKKDDHASKKHGDSEDKDNKEKGKDEKDGGHDKPKKKKKEAAGDDLDEDSPGASLRLELWLPVPISDLKSTKKGPLNVFLDTLQEELSAAAHVEVKRLDVLGVRGEYADEGVLSFFARDVKASLQEGPVVAEEISHSIIDLEVLPATQASDPSPQHILRVLRDELVKEDSSLMTGPLKDTLRGARLVIRQGVEGLLPHEKSAATLHDLRLLLLTFVAVAFLSR